MREAEALCRAFVHGQPIPKGGGYKQNRFKAWRILETKDTSLVTGVKVRPFFECIMGSLDKFVMDRHIARLWVSLQTPGKVSYATSVHQACEADFRAFAEYVGEPVGLVQERAWQGYLKVVQNR